MEPISYHIEICSRLPFLPFQEFETTSPQPQRRIYPDSFQQHLHVSTASLAFVKTFRPERFLRVRGSSYFAREMESSRGRRGFVPVTNDPRDENTRKGYVAEWRKRNRRDASPITDFLPGYKIHLTSRESGPCSLSRSWNDRKKKISLCSSSFSNRNE